MITIVVLQKESISLSEAMRHVGNNGEGGVVMSYSGIVRVEENRINGELQGIEFETCSPLFEGESIRLIKEISDSLGDGLLSVTFIHRDGQVKVGEVISLLIVVAKHSHEALKAIEYITAAIKSRVPMFKKLICKEGYQKLIRNNHRVQ